MKNYELDTKKIISTLVAAGVLASGTAVFAEYYPEKTADPNLDYTTTSATDGEAVNNGSESGGYIQRSYHSCCSGCKR